MCRIRRRNATRVDRQTRVRWARTMRRARARTRTPREWLWVRSSSSCARDVVETKIMDFDVSPRLGRARRRRATCDAHR